MKDPWEHGHNADLDDGYGYNLAELELAHYLHSQRIKREQLAKQYRDAARGWWYSPLSRLARAIRSLRGAGVKSDAQFEADLNVEYELMRNDGDPKAWDVRMAMDKARSLQESDFSLGASVEHVKNLPRRKK